jgi:hypothetical protein
LAAISFAAARGTASLDAPAVADCEGVSKDGDAVDAEAADGEAAGAASVLAAAGVTVPAGTSSVTARVING